MSRMCVNSAKQLRQTAFYYQHVTSYEDSLQQIFESYPIQKSVGKLLFVQHGLNICKWQQVDVTKPPRRSRTPG